MSRPIPRSRPLFPARTDPPRAPTRTAVLNLVRTRAPITPAALATSLGRTLEAIRAHLRELARGGWVERRSGGWVPIHGP